jgi:hypothetical protein
LSLGIDTGPLNPADFGVPLNPAALDAHLAQQHEAQIDYRRLIANSDGLAARISEVKKDILVHKKTY